MFLSTPPSRVATVLQNHSLIESRNVSIHATLAGGDLPRSALHAGSCVSIHATLAGGDIEDSAIHVTAEEFLSTPPSRVATSVIPFEPMWEQLFLSTPPSRVATAVAGGVITMLIVSIHATLAGGDILGFFAGGAVHQFLSTPPSRVAT